MAGDRPGRPRLGRGASASTSSPRTRSTTSSRRIPQVGDRLGRANRNRHRAEGPEWVCRDLPLDQRARTRLWCYHGCGSRYRQEDARIDLEHAVLGRLHRPPLRRLISPPGAAPGRLAGSTQNSLPAGSAHHGPARVPGRRSCAPRGRRSHPGADQPLDLGSAVARPRESTWAAVLDDLRARHPLEDQRRPVDAWVVRRRLRRRRTDRRREPGRSRAPPTRTRRAARLGTASSDRRSARIAELRAEDRRPPSRRYGGRRSPSATRGSTGGPVSASSSEPGRDRAGPAGTARGRATATRGSPARPSGAGAAGCRRSAG